MKKKTTKTNGQLLSELDLFCRNQNWHFSVTWQRINDYSVEIYKGYTKTYQSIFYSDGHSTMREALKESLKFIKNKENENNKI